METVKIKCSRCKAILTNTLKQSSVNLNHFDEGEEIIEKGHYCDGNEDISIAHNDRILINNKDSKLLNHKQLKNYYGCCGHFDTDFLNQICPNCKLEVATIVNECYTYHYIALQRDKIILEKN